MRSIIQFTFVLALVLFSTSAKTAYYFTGGGSTVSVVVPPVTLIDRSGTIILGGAAQTISIANSIRHGFWIQNQSAGDLWMSTIGTAAAGEPNIWLPSGAYFEFPYTGVPSTAISLWGNTTGQPYTAREW